ncbi:MAG: flagellar hook-associated protein FlgL [Lachnospiraceae bacterium]|nr:flagellar hook-associated protein FlgL [Lachnospiraceae bacterium]
MRVTNNMIMKSSTNNVNATKVNVNEKNNQMTTNKKISRPSEDPVVAIRSLRLSTTLNKLDQYVDKNIPDAASWLEVTETAILNMKSLVTDVRTQCVNGSTGTLTADDRNTILSQLEALQKQMYSEGNADYAGRTVFTGYRTNSTLTFTSDEAATNYNIVESFSAVEDLSEMRYYDGEVEVPSTPAGVIGDTISDITETVYNRIRLPYNDIDKVKAIKYTPNGGTETDFNMSKVHIYDNEEEWSADVGAKTVADDEIVVIKSTGELIMGDTIATTLKQNKAAISVNYDKTGFKQGELRPEFYYNCTDNTNPLDPVTYTRYDDEGELIRFDIEYNVAANQNLGVNIEAIDVFDSELIQDVNGMVDAVNAAINAHDKVDKIKSMMKENQYSTEAYQEKLQEWLEAAQKEADYYDDNIQKLFSETIGKADSYLSNINLAVTKIGCKSDQLSITQDRVGNQQTTVSELQSNNDDVDLSQIILEYTSAYTAYQSSLTAASKLGQVSLLQYI